jgi:hypothetical protein
VEERFFTENHGRKHGAQAPHVQTIIVFLVVNQKLGCLGPWGGNADIIFCSWMVELGQTPVDKSKLCWVMNAGLKSFNLVWLSHLSVFMVNHYIVRSYISVYNAVTVGKIQSLKQLENIESDIDVAEFGIETSEIIVVNVFKDQ